jgi:SdrD B-like domain
MKTVVNRVWSITASMAMVAIVSLVGAPADALACQLGIGDRVWHDANGNGIQDNGEPGLNGVRVTISPGYYANPLDPGSFVTSMVTASGPGGDGYYLFRPVDCDADYTIAVDPSTVPAGLSATLVGVGADPAVDSDNPAGTIVNLPNLGFDYSNLTIDFGFVAPACTGMIGNRVWNDANNNGIQDPGEANWEGAVVTLTPGGSVATDAAGEYLFSGLCAGTYQVCVAPPSGAQASPANQGGDDEADSDGVVGSGGVCTAVTLPAPNTVDLSNDFGFHVPPTPGAGTGTPGYWKNHPEAWPVDSIVIGGVLYSKSQAIALMDAGGGDKTYTMFMHLVATKLNLLIGTEAGCIAGTVGLADAWLSSYPVGSGVKGSSLAWKNGEPLSVQLDRYNNGMLCAPARD